MEKVIFFKFVWVKKIKGMEIVYSVKGYAI